VGFQQQERFKAIGWIVDPGQPADQLRDDRRLIVERDQNAVAGPDRGRIDERRGTAAGQHQHNPPGGADEEAELDRQDRQGSGDYRCGCRRRDDGAARSRQYRELTGADAQSRRAVPPNRPLADPVP